MSGVISRSAKDQRMLIWLGVLWLGLAAAILITQLIRPPQIQIVWQTESEFETAGYNIYRSEVADGDYTQINTAMILSGQDALAGSEYAYVDTNIEPGRTYFYRLEEVELDGSTTFYDAEPGEPISGSFHRLEWWAIVFVPLSSLVGILLLSRSFRTKKEYEF